MFHQRTISEKVSCTGVGVHSGRDMALEILPAPENNGITFHRTDRPGHAELKASVEHVTDTTLATTLSAGVNGSRVSVSTVEHLLAAFRGLGIDNAQVYIDGPEIPILDGSSGPFVELLSRAGIEVQRSLKKFLVIKKELRVRDGDKEARIAPGMGLRITCSIDFDHPLMPPTPYTYELDPRTFAREIAPARTFGFYRDVEMLRSRGLAQGGSLDNAVVIDGYKVLNREGLRFPDEFVRHKILDAIGDLSLIGMPIIGRVTMKRPGHALNTDLVRTILADPKSYEVVSPEPVELERASRGEPSRFAAFGAVETLA